MNQLDVDNTVDSPIKISNNSIKTRKKKIRKSNFCLYSSGNLANRLSYQTTQLLWKRYKYSLKTHMFRLLVDKLMIAFS